MSKDNDKPATPRTKTPQLEFVTATNPKQFKDKDTMRQVRKTVMHSYLNKAEQDPDCQDVRVRNKRTHKRAFSAIPSAGPSSSAAIPIPSSTSAELPVIPSSDTAVQTAGSNSEEILFQFEHHDPYPTPGGSSASSLAQSISTFDAISAANFSQFTASSMPTLSTSEFPSNYMSIADPDASDNVIFGDTALVTRRERNREPIPFDVAYSTPYGFHIDSRIPDPFATLNILHNGSINVELLKSNCTSFFGSKAMLDHWIPFLTKSPSVFLSCLCISAPYMDIMAQSNYWDSHTPVLPDQRQTMELLTEVPKLIKNSLSDPSEGFSDSNIVAVVQLIAGQIMSDYTWIVPWHRSYLKHMVSVRGGLEELGGDEVVAVGICQTDFEAAIMANEALDPTYLEYAREYVDRHPYLKFPAPESPLICRDSGMGSIASIKLCNSQSLHLIILGHQLTDTCLKLNRLEQRKNSPTGPHPPAAGQSANDLQFIIVDIANKIHEMLPADTPGHSGHKDSCYEAIRLASIVYAHAIVHRVPIHEALHISCRVSNNLNVRTPPCAVTPGQIQETVQQTNMDEAWDRLGGTLYWILMIAAAASHEPSTDTSTPNNARKDSLLSVRRPQSGSSQTQKGKGLQRSESAPITQQTSTQPFQMPYISSAHQSSGQVSTTKLVWTPAPISTSRSDSYQIQSVAPKQPWHSSIVDASARALQQFMDSQKPTPMTSATPSLTGSSSYPHTPSPPSAPRPYTAATSQPSQFQHSSTPTAPPQQSQTPQMANQYYLSSNTSSELQHFKRPRTSTEPASSRAIMRPSREEERRWYQKKYLIANAVRTSIVLRFEHTTAMLTAAIKLGEVQDYLNWRNTPPRKAPERSR
ncbi:fungal specific transcription factor domain-containing protein 26 [Elsinoe australis]|uniref:Fungal specific transcription factor domain-containing protein 26 n=1 Tax=Elsinoe australis TaxID=40998 RepID=A0A4V6DUJ4_9PEZI|nr:fungal specific transcription factor domain-containing protein 26 [Elsinoe australis]